MAKPTYTPKLKHKKTGSLKGLKEGTRPASGLLPKLGNLLKPSGSTKGKLK